MSSSQIEFSKSVNCQACGEEFVNKELTPIKLAGSNSVISVCEHCLDKTAENAFKDAADILNDIVSIAKSKEDASNRLSQIKALIGK